MQVDDTSLHGKDNQQAVEILKQTGPVVRLKVARHINRRFSRTHTASMSSQASAELVETSPAVAQAKPFANEPIKGIKTYCTCITTRLPPKEMNMGLPYYAHIRHLTVFKGFLTKFPDPKVRNISQIISTLPLPPHSQI